MRTISDVDVKGKRVLLRAGLNVPIGKDGAITDTYRLDRALMTINDLAAHGARTVIVAHLGRNGDSLRAVYEALAARAKVRISFFDGALAQAPEQAALLADGECLMLENIRRYPGEEANDPALARELAALGDLFVNDAFADSHRAHASIVGVAQLLPSYAGLLMQEEVEQLSSALVPPAHSLAIMGGAKFETKQPLIEKLLRSYERVCVGGALGSDMMKACGLSVGTSLVSEMLPPHELTLNTHIYVPSDVMVHGEKGDRATSTHNIQDDESIVDIGPSTLEAWSTMIAEAPLILWNGPLGIYEDGYGAGTDAIAKTIDTKATRAIVGGGDTLAAIEKYSFDPSRVFLSTGGGAMLEFLTAGTLPGIEVLGN
ncbi:MAG TPA: phosphoglycerate kinase [Candidatus Paceibacterota bacterium]